MKYGHWALMATIALSLNAQAIYRPGWERPIAKAALTEVDSSESQYPQPEVLTMNKQDGARRITSFSLQEDTGLRCITTPCPSSRTTTFSVTKVRRIRNGIQYQAREVRLQLHHEPFMPSPFRTLIVNAWLDDSDSSVGTQWDVKLNDGLGHTRRFEGTPEPVYTIQ